MIAVPVSLIGAFAGLCAVRLLDQHADAVRDRARHRHRRRRRHRGAGERRAPDGASANLSPKRGGDRVDARSAPARSSPSSWCCARCSSRSPSSAASPASSTSSSRSRVATAVIISGIVALTLTPALCALLLKPQHKEPRAVPSVQPRLRLAHAHLPRRRATWRCGRSSARAARSSSLVIGACAAAVHGRPGQLRAAGGPGLHLRLDHAARRRDAGAHRRRSAPSCRRWSPRIRRSSTCSSSTAST